jgi:UDP-2,3-diacylglucosamine hydrolase
MGRILFVGDVHLRPGEPAENLPFLRFLEQEAEAIYLLGDLFDLWVGPAMLDVPDYRAEIEALRRCSKRTRLLFLKGNRDFIVDGRFERRLGLRVLGDRARVTEGGRSIELAHGDMHFNMNPKYTAYRALIRCRPIEALWRQVPPWVSLRTARGFEKVSVRTTTPRIWKPEEIFEVARPAFDAGADVFMAGHIHQPNHVARDYRGRRREALVVGDWDGGTRDYVELESGEFRLKRWETAPAATPSRA